MKNNKYILSILRTLVIVLTVVLVVVVYWNGRRKMAAKRSDAVEALRVSAQSVINREGKKMRFPVYTQRTDRKDYTKRRIVIKGGTFTVTIDPLKEAQGLYPLEAWGRQSGCCNLIRTVFLMNYWQPGERRWTMKPLK